MVTNLQHICLWCVIQEIQFLFSSKEPPKQSREKNGGDTLFPFVVTEGVISSAPLANEINYVDWLEILGSGA